MKLEKTHQELFLLKTFIFKKEPRIYKDGSWFLAHDQLVKPRMGLKIDRVLYWLDKFQKKEWIVYHYPEDWKIKKKVNGFLIDSYFSTPIKARIKEINSNQTTLVYDATNWKLSVGDESARFNKRKGIENGSRIVFEYLCRHLSQNVSADALKIECKRFSLTPDIQRTIFDLNIKLKNICSPVLIEGGKETYQLPGHVTVRWPVSKLGGKSLVQ